MPIAFWQLCFGDTDAFLSSYFREVYRDDSTLVGYTEGRSDAHLQYLPVELSSGGERYPVSYVVGGMYASRLRWTWFDEGKS